MSEPTSTPKWKPGTVLCENCGLTQCAHNEYGECKTAAASLFNKETPNTVAGSTSTTGDKYEGCICLQDDHNKQCPAIQTGRCHFQSLYKANHEWKPRKTINPGIPGLCEICCRPASEHTPMAGAASTETAEQIAKRWVNCANGDLTVFAAASAITEATAKRDERWAAWGVVEVAVRNPQVAEYCKHWEERVQKLQAEVAALKAECNTTITKAQESYSVMMRHWEARDKAEADLTAAEQENQRLREALEQIKNECEKHRNEPHAYEGYCCNGNLLPHIIAERALLSTPAVPVPDYQSENQRLREALTQYGWHDSNCPLYDDAGKNVASACNCGFMKAVTLLSTPAPQPGEEKKHGNDT